MAGPGFIGTDEFIKRAKAVHGDYYDYSKSEYKTVKDKLVIICPNHGEFLQSPEMHMKGYGCRKCAVEKRRQTMQDRYGVDFASQSDAIQAKSKETRQHKFGTQKPPGSGKKRMTKETFVSRAQELHGDRYDYSLVEMQGTDVKVKIICPDHGEFLQTPAKHLLGRGCPHKDCIAKKKVESNMARYGVPNAMQSSEVVERQKQSCMETYGVSNPMHVPEVKQQVRQANMDKYGVPCVLALDEVKRQGWLKKLEDGTCNTSKSQEKLYELLRERFGPDDVKREYISDLYPYHCDFYIASRDMYIELNGNFTHGNHWYTGNDMDLQQRSDLEKLAEEKNSDYYRNAVLVWTKNDVDKRNMARQSDLNYIVFWGTSLHDAALWFAMGCPDGKDWDYEYSWLPQRSLSGATVFGGQALTGTPTNLSAIAKQIQFREFYHREIAMWEENPMVRGLPLQVFLYHNRLKYINKLPQQLTDMELARGFTISGILKGYTVFHSDMMDAVMQKYQIQSVYDPCAGWGERALYCKSHGDIPYLGVDVNINLFPGYDVMSARYGLYDRQKFYHGSSANISLSGQYDAVVTCPPYGDTEIYSEFGAENYDCDRFLNWWTEVVENSKKVCPRLFCFQVNRAWRDRMLSVVEKQGFVLEEEVFPVKKSSSHFTRGKDGVDYKKEFETMLVCRKV